MKRHTLFAAFVTAAIPTAVASAILLLTVFDGTLRIAFTDSVEILGLALAATFMWLARGRHTGRNRRCITLLAIAFTSVTFGLVSVGVWDLGAPSPFFALAGVFQVTGLLCALPALFLLPAAHSNGSRAATLLDGAAFASGLFFMGAATIIPFELDHIGFAPQAVAYIFYIFMDTLLLTVIVAGARRAPATARLPISLIAGGAAFNMLSNFAHTYLSATNEYSVGKLPDVFIFVCAALFGLAAWRTWRVPWPDVTEDAKPAGSLFLVMPYIPMAVAIPVALWRAALPGSLSILEVAALSVTFATVIARQFAMLLDNRRLALALSSREQEMQFRAYHDPLTGLANRALFLARCGETIGQRRADRRVNRAAILFIDLDDFKTVNDTMGHEIGDQLLVVVGERLTAAVRPGDLVARLGGDEFAVLVTALDNDSDAVIVAERIISAVHKPADVAGRVVEPACSVGVAVAAEGSTVSKLLTEADFAMYVAKGRGKGVVETYKPTTHDSAVR